MKGFLLVLGLIICSTLLCFFLLCTFSFVVTCIREKLPLIRHNKKGLSVGKKSILERLFFDFPVQLGRDLALDRGGFPEKGIVIFEGDQGDGKTISLVKYAYDLKKNYQDCLILSNTPITFQDGTITSFDSFVGVSNGTDGIVGIIDECQLWANSKLSKEVDLNLLQTCCQNRKNRRLLLMTGQRFYMLNKDIRCLCNEVRSCRTYFGVLTFVTRRKPFFDSEGKIIKTKWLGMYFFVQNDELRNLYNTYATISTISKSGFKPKERRFNSYE